MMLVLVRPPFSFSRYQLRIVFAPDPPLMAPLEGMREYPVDFVRARPQRVDDAVVRDKADRRYESAQST